MIAHGRAVLSQDFLSVLNDDALVFLANADAHEVVHRDVGAAVGVHLVDAILTAGDDDGHRGRWCTNLYWIHIISMHNSIP